MVFEVVGGAGFVGEAAGEGENAYVDDCVIYAEPCEGGDE